MVRRIAAQPALAPFSPEEWKPGPQYDSDADLIRLAGDIATTIFHPVGTTKMGGEDDPMAVLNARFELRDSRGGTVHGLRVVDAGAMPTITSGNTNSPTLMMAEKAAGWLTGR
jgi:choline dehydrogenase